MGEKGKLFYFIPPKIGFLPNSTLSPTTLQKSWPKKLTITDGNMAELVGLPRP